MKRWALLLVLASCGLEALPDYPKQPRQDEAVGLILDAYELGRPPLAIEWVKWTDCGQGYIRHGRACVEHATDPGPVFRLLPPRDGRYSYSPLPAMICRHFVRECPLAITDRALNALYHAGL